MQIYISRDGQQFGPYSVEEIEEHVGSNQIHETDLAWVDGMHDWVPLNQLSTMDSHKEPMQAQKIAPQPSYQSAVRQSSEPSLTERAQPAPQYPVTQSPSPNPTFALTPVALRTDQPPTSQTGTVLPVTQDKSLMQKIGGGLLAAGYAAFKFKYLAFGVLKTSLSMLLMIWIYSHKFGWNFAVGFVVLIFIHEMGHVAAAWWVGLPVTAPLFIPFVGALITMEKNPTDAWTEAIVGYGGPLAGCIGSAICLALGISLNIEWMVAVASLSFVVNMFNMIPVPPLDGGRICAAISTWFWVFGVILLVAALFYFHSLRSTLVIGFLVIVYSARRLYNTFFVKITPEMEAYYKSAMGPRILMAVLYLGLLGGLMLGYMVASQRLEYLWEQNSN